MSQNCQTEVVPNPWIRTMSGRVGFRVLGTQQCMTVPSPRSVETGRSPDLVKVDLRHQVLDAVMLKHLDLDIALIN